MVYSKVVEVGVGLHQLNSLDASGSRVAFGSAYRTEGSVVSGSFHSRCRFKMYLAISRPRCKREPSADAASDERRAARVNQVTEMSGREALGAEARRRRPAAGGALSPAAATAAASNPAVT